MPNTWNAQATERQHAKPLHGLAHASPHDFGCALTRKDILRKSMQFGDLTSKVPVAKPHRRVVRFVRH